MLVNGATSAEGQAKVAELFSVPRVTRLLRPSVSLGVDRREALARIREQKAYLVIGSPPCTAFSRLKDGWNYRRMDPEVVRRR